MASFAKNDGAARLHGTSPSRVALARHPDPIGVLS